jgi:hypothetical protein
LELWITRFYITTADAFPSTQRRSPVVAVREFVLNPIEAAVVALTERTVALLDVIERSAAGPDRGADQDFSSKLQGVVDAAVSGGVANYSPFLTGDFRRTHPEIAADMDPPAHGGRKAGLIDELRAALMAQLRVVARGIRVHAVKCATEMLPLHDFLVKRFASMRATMQELGVYEQQE